MAEERQKEGLANGAEGRHKDKLAATKKQRGGNSGETSK